MKSGIAAYRRIQREATSDSASMGTLLRVLVDSILVGRRALVAHDLATSNKHFVSAQQVLVQLRNVNWDGTENVGQNLRDLFSWCEIALGKANISHDVEVIDSVTVVLGNLRDGFEGIFQGADS